MDIDSLLRLTSSAALGPISLSYAASGTGEWTLTVTLAERHRTIQAERESGTEGLVLTCKLDAGSVESAPRGAWVTQDDSALDGSIARRIWLHGDGLTPALLLNALAELARVAAPDPTPASDEPEPVVLTAPDETPSISEPAPTPAPRAKILPWQRLNTAPDPEPEPAPAPVEAVVEPEPVATSTEDPAEEVIAEATTPAPPQPDEPIEPVSPATAPQPIPAAIDPLPAVPTASQATAATQTPPSVTVTPDGSTGRSGTCRECGTPFKADHAFCTNCGIRLE